MNVSTSVQRRRVLVFDSGLGGLTVFACIAEARPDLELVYAADDAFFPYGALSEAALIERVGAVMDDLIARTAPDVVVIACNTASTLVLPPLRAAYPHLPFVGTVPAIKPAAVASKSRMISVLATPGTVARDYTRALVRDFAAGCEVTLVGAPHLAGLAESRLRGEPVSDVDVAREIEPCFVARAGRRTDQVVLACTHFPLLISHFERLAPWPVAFVDPAPAIARRVDSLVGVGGPTGEASRPFAAFFTSGRPPSEALRKALRRLGLTATSAAERAAADQTRRRGCDQRKAVGMRTAQGQPVRLEDYRVPDFLVDAVDLEISLDREATRVVATLGLRPHPQGRPDAALELDGDELELVAAALDGATLAPEAYKAAPSGFVLPDPPRRPFTLRLETRLNPSANTKLMGLYRSGAAYCTQCEAEGFRRITYFPDRPDVLSTYRVRLEADKTEAPVLLANGNLEGAGDAEGGRHWAVWRDPFKKPCYLFAVVAGDLAHITDTFVTMSGRRVALGVYVEHGREERAAYAMDALKRSMAWDERAFGREYDLDCFNIVAVSDFNMGAMENKGLNVFNDKYVLASPQTATDDDYAGIEGVIAHEYFHNWTGNRITCRDWFQLCLKEGLTVFRDQEFSADQRSAPVKRIADVRGLRAAQFAEDAGPLAHPVRPSVYHEINNFYTATVYQKGAELIRMLRALIGAEAFRAGMDLYFSRCDGTAATVEDFLACFAEVSGRDLTNFKLWYAQAGTPVLTVRTHWDEGQGTLRLDVAQSLAPTPGQHDKSPVTMPIALGFVDRDDGDIPLVSAEASAHELETGVFVLEGERRSIAFTGLKRRPALSFLRGFSAPVRVEDDLVEDDLLTLLARDSDSFNRWQALQTLATRLLLRAVSAIRVGAKPTPDPAFVEAYGSVAADALAGRIDPAFAALALTLPSEGDLAREMALNVDPDAIHRVREDLRGALGRAHAEALTALHARAADAPPFSPDAASAGRRALRNVALAMVVAGNAVEGADLAHRQIAEADNMSARLGALAAIAAIPGARRERTLQAFARRFAAEPLILDKWFALQAQIPENKTLDRVRELMTHHAFSLRNPNRVRSLIGGFAANATQFNRADGAGYDFLADIVLELDPTNPQVAARLLTAMRSWRSLEPQRQARAESALRRILAQPQLSADVRDIAGRSLG